jgi:hypothetical protein
LLLTCVFSLDRSGGQVNFKNAPWAKAWKDQLESIQKKLGQSTAYMTAMLTGRALFFQLTFVAVRLKQQTHA